MLMIGKKKQDNYGLTKSVQLPDIKQYLQDEFVRAAKREDEIQELENQIQELQEIKLKYDAMLVVQVETKKRIENQDKKIEYYRQKILEKEEEIKTLSAEKIDIKINAEKKLEEREQKIKELQKQVKELKKGKTNGSSRKNTKKKAPLQVGKTN